MKALLKQSGYSLVEISIGLAIVGIVVGSGFSLLGAYMDNARQNATQSHLEIAKRATLDFVKINKYMPCPDSSIPTDGIEDRNQNGACDAKNGRLPYVNLGLSKANSSDQWNNVFVYGINSEATDLNSIQNSGKSASFFARNNAPVFTITTPPTENQATVIENFNIEDTTGKLELQSMPAVIIAFNENGHGVDLENCNNQVSAQKQPHETINCSNNQESNRKLIRHHFFKEEYNDQFITISANEIKQQVLNDLVNIQNPKEDSGFCDPDNFGYVFNVDKMPGSDLTVGTNGDDMVFINGNLDKQLNLQQGNDILAIMGDVNAKINFNGTATIFIPDFMFNDPNKKQQLEDNAPGATILSCETDYTVTTVENASECTGLLSGVLCLVEKIIDEGTDTIDNIVEESTDTLEQLTANDYNTRESCKAAGYKWNIIFGCRD